jgi:hypothetical protein
MPYVPRPSTEVACAHCGTPFLQQHRRRKYCCNSCNVLASYQRTGRRGSASPTKAELAQVLTQVLALVQEPLLVAPVLAPAEDSSPAAVAERARVQREQIELLRARVSAQTQATRIAALRAARRAPASEPPA